MDRCPAKSVSKAMKVGEESRSEDGARRGPTDGEFAGGMERYPVGLLQSNSSVGKGTST